MYSILDISIPETIILAWFSLAWLIVGVLVGQRLLAASRRGNQKRGPRRRGSVEIYVGNLAYDVNERGLTKVFARYGDVGSIRIIKNNATGKSKGYGFVEMYDRKEAQSAIKELHGSDLKGRDLVINEARSDARAGRRNDGGRHR